MSDWCCHYDEGYDAGYDAGLNDQGEGFRSELKKDFEKAFKLLEEVESQALYQETIETRTIEKISRFIDNHASICS